MACIDYKAESYWTGVMNASLCKLFILRALTDGPAHGYEIIHRVDVITESFCVPTEGTIYPVLREFLECGCASCSEETVNGRTRKVYSLTEKGLESYKSGVEVWKHGMCCVRTAIAGGVQ